MLDSDGIRTRVLVARLDPGQEFELAHILGLPIEFLLYGIYVFSFIVSLTIVHRQKRRFTFSAKIFFVANISLFVMATLFAIIGLSRIVQAFVTNPAGPSNFLNYPTWIDHWENLAFYVLLYLMANAADALVIYRCYIIWAHNIYVVIIPILLALSSFASGIPMLISFGHPDLIPNHILNEFLRGVYPIHFAQNIVTTSLIVWRLWRQHRASARAGVRTLGTSLVQISRIIVESAMIYTVILLGMIVLASRNSVFLFTLQYALVPSIGIVFNFISIRVYIVQTAAASRMPDTNVLPQFVTDISSQETSVKMVDSSIGVDSSKGSIREVEQHGSSRRKSGEDGSSSFEGNRVIPTLNNHSVSS